MHAVVIGHVCIDRNTSEHASYVAAGSPALFISKVYAQFPQVATSIIAPYGTDMLPYLAKQHMLPHEPTSETTLVYENISHGNKRTQFAHNTKCAQPIELNADMKNAIHTADILFFAPLTPSYPVSYIKEMMKYKSKHTLAVILPQGYYRSINVQTDKVSTRDFSEAHRIIPYFDFVIVSNEDHPAMQRTALSWSKKTTVIVTAGDHGADIFEKEVVSHVKTEPVKVENIVDSVGSGDIFSASFAYKYVLTKNVVESVEFANKIARQCLFYPSTSLTIDIPDEGHPES